MKKSNESIISLIITFGFSMSMGIFILGLYFFLGLSLEIAVFPAMAAVSFTTAYMWEKIRPK